MTWHPSPSPHPWLLLAKQSVSKRESAATSNNYASFFSLELDKAKTIAKWSILCASCWPMVNAIIC